MAPRTDDDERRRRYPLRVTYGDAVLEVDVEAFFEGLEQWGRAVYARVKEGAAERRRLERARKRKRRKERQRLARERTADHE